MSECQPRQPSTGIALATSTPRRRSPVIAGEKMLCTTTSPRSISLTRRLRRSPTIRENVRSAGFSLRMPMMASIFFDRQIGEIAESYDSRPFDGFNAASIMPSVGSRRNATLPRQRSSSSQLQLSRSPGAELRTLSRAGIPAESVPWIVRQHAAGKSGRRGSRGGHPRLDIELAEKVRCRRARRSSTRRRRAPCDFRARRRCGIDFDRPYRLRRPHQIDRVPLVIDIEAVRTRRHGLLDLLDAVDHLEADVEAQVLLGLCGRSAPGEFRAGQATRKVGRACASRVTATLLANRGWRRRQGLPIDQRREVTRRRRAGTPERPTAP